MGPWELDFVSMKTQLGCVEAGEDALLLFYLHLMHHLNARDLFPPDLHRYAGNLDVPQPSIQRLRFDPADAVPAAWPARPERPTRETEPAEADPPPDEPSAED